MRAPRTSRAAGAVVAMGLAVVLSACSGSSSEPAPTPIDLSAAAGSTATVTPIPGTTSTLTTPPTPTKSPVFSAKPAPFTKPVTFRDGVFVAVTKAEKGTITATGPGQLTGTQTATFTLRFTNHTANNLDLRHVLVLASFGRKDTAASPVYDAIDAQDFATVVRPGRSAVTRYQFAVPAADLDDVTLEVKFDSNHSAALFKGPVKISKD